MTIRATNSVLSTNCHDFVIGSSEATFQNALIPDEAASEKGSRLPRFVQKFRHGHQYSRFRGLVTKSTTDSSRCTSENPLHNTLAAAPFGASDQASTSDELLSLMPADAPQSSTIKPSLLIDTQPRKSEDLRGVAQRELGNDQPKVTSTYESRASDMSLRYIEMLAKSYRQLQDNPWERADREIGHWLQSMENRGMATMHQALQHKRIRTRQASTAHRFVQYMNSWLVKETQPVLWVSKMQGVGKSMSIAALVDDLTSDLPATPVDGVAVVYFRWDQMAHESALGIYASLLSQLRHRSVALAYTLDTLYRQWKGKKTLPLGQDLRRQLTNLKAASNPGGRLLLIFDAIDQANSETQEEIMDLLRHLDLDLFRVVITCREDRSSLPRDLATVYRLQPKAKELREYISFELLQGCAGLKHDERLLGKLISNVYQRTDGIYLHAYMYIQHVINSGIFDRDWLAASKAEFSVLNDVYGQTVTRIESTSMHKNHAMLALAWVTFSAETLGVYALLQAVTGDPYSRSIGGAMNEDILNAITKDCCGLLVADKIELDAARSVRLCHPAAKAYLRALPGIQSHKEEIAITCTDILQKVRPQSQRSTGPMIWGRLGDLYDYAANHWSTHLDACHEWTTPDSPVFAAVLRLYAHFDQNGWMHHVDCAGLRWLEAPAKPNALSMACFYGHTSVVKHLLTSSHASRELVHLRSAMSCAAARGHLDCLEIAYGYFEARLGTVSTQSTIVSSTVSDAVREDVDHDLNGCFESELNDRTPLFAAICNGHIDCIKFLLRKGHFTTSAKDAYGHSVLSQAIAYCDGEILDLLLEHSSDETCNAPDDEGYIPLARTMGTNGFPKSAQKLLKRTSQQAVNILVSPHDRDSVSLLVLAIESQQSDFAEMLITQTEIDLDWTSDDSPSAALLAAEHGLCDTLRLLVEHGADMSGVDYDAETLFTDGVQIRLADEEAWYDICSREREQSMTERRCGHDAWVAPEDVYGESVVW